VEPTNSDSAAAFPPFRLKDINGNEFDSSVLLGKVSLVNFWASRCAPCKVETPILLGLKEELEARGFEIVGTVVDPENESAIKEFAEAKDLQKVIEKCFSLKSRLCWETTGGDYSCANFSRLAISRSSIRRRPRAIRPCRCSALSAVVTVSR
jgi:thiol-disulfide isomerase/thioredoxin